MKKIFIEQEKPGSLTRTNYGYRYRALHVAVLVGAIMAVNQAYAASGDLLFSGPVSGKLSFGSAECTPMGESIGTFTAPAYNPNRGRGEDGLAFSEAGYELLLYSKKFGHCRRVHNSQGIFWHHVGDKWSLKFKDVKVSCTNFDVEPWVTVEINLNGTFACTQNITENSLRVIESK
ncbi:hypothetical protein [Halothiobacillus sp.]|jgi:hypothetical protein|uniref:hypothetical protein n=1 Tax=Halothiobacillus sp. TaxID=1891311 RepID=UPI00262558D4|nr:hypothetical protein [Halothiobacillus sp.]MDD3576937.1 hypothetical protein [Halothiobacillus sp.]MDD4967498.1 hypothetical protein [Halothiobacillus sp.]MDY0134263.1 hypothetical protein [Atribacterota bacterium]